MRYFIENSTLFLRGKFLAASTGINGGLNIVSTILNHTVPDNWSHNEPTRYLETIIAREGYSLEFFGLLTAVKMHNLCILQYDFVNVFITAGVTNPKSELPHTINIIVYTDEGFSQAALLETIITVTEAKVMALKAMGYAFTGTTTDAVVVACEGVLKHTYAGTLTAPGSRIYEAVVFGVKEALKRQEGLIKRSAPSFFIFSRYGGDHWVEWTSENCPYYPCHFEGQRCDFCYCPLYPCQDESLGKWVESSQGGMIWSCSGCSLLHEPKIAEYVKEYPEVRLKELKALKKRIAQ